MTDFQLYHEYDKQDILGSFKGAGRPRTFCDGQWVIFPDVILCFTTVGPTPRTSYFNRGAKFRWVADRPYQMPPAESGVPSWSHLQIVPNDVIGGNVKGRPIYLFIRQENSIDYLYFGRLGPSYMQQGASANNHGEAEFDLSPTLPSTVWSNIGGFNAGDRNHDEVDAALGRLTRSMMVGDRLEVLKRLIEYWHGPVSPSDGYSDSDMAGVRAPAPLQWWYRWAGKRTEIMTGQNILFAPKNEAHKYWELAVYDGYLHFYIENQGVYQWATLPDGDDPPVFGRYECNEPWQREDLTLSEHLILASIFEAVICHARYGASRAYLPHDKFREFASLIPPLEIGAWRWAHGLRAYAKNGVFMCASGSEKEGGYSVWVGAKTEHPLQVLKPLVNTEWEYVSL